jgi:hypothetical protein
VIIAEKQKQKRIIEFKVANEIQFIENIPNMLEKFDEKVDNCRKRSNQIFH